MPSDLPPLDFTEEIEKYEAKEERKEVAFPKCNHSKAVIKEGRLHCRCGVSYYGTLDQLLELQM